MRCRYTKRFVAARIVSRQSTAKVMSIRLIVVDDHMVVRRGLEVMLDGSDIEIVGEAANCEQAISLVSLIPAQVVLMDVRMPEQDGLGCMAHIKELKPELKILLYSAFSNPAYVSRAISLGAAGYVVKSESRQALIDAIHKVSEGESVWSREDLRRVTSSMSTQKQNIDVEVPLTQRESEVLVQLTFGKTNKEIAAILEISYETVKEHVQHILRKIGVSDRTQAAVWAVRNGLV